MRTGSGDENGDARLLGFHGHRDQDRYPGCIDIGGVTEIEEHRTAARRDRGCVGLLYLILSISGQVAV